MTTLARASTTMLCLVAASAISAFAQTETPPKDDPFADVTPAAPAPDATGEPERSWMQNFFTENFGFRKEIMSEFDSNADGSGASRQSIGFEILKKFSNSTSTLASFDFQARLVQRNGYNLVPNDIEGIGHQGWTFEYHNLYLDLYNIFRARNVGRFNFRIGHTYVPFGLNLQTDTHGTLLQLSNGDDFGFDQDWSAGFWGSLNRNFNYNVSYLLGSGCDLRFKGQSGLAAARVSLSDHYSSAYGIEGGLSAIAGDRLVMPMQQVNGVVAPLETQRIGIDGRYKHTAPKGLLTFTTEFSGGRDAWNPVISELHQAEYLHASRRWAVASQFRRLFEETHGANSSLIGEFTWYFRNDVANSNSHWIKLNIERQLESVTGRPHTIVTLQYYFYL